jgi:excinuclease ABC subunit B
MPEKDKECELRRLEKEMVEAARNLEFEKAAAQRDRLFALREAMFGVALPAET